MSSAEERKVVSVLFADLVDFVRRGDQLDPEDLRALLAPYYARLRAELESFGGTVEKFIGDAVMAVFGAPVAHEDDAERAVRAGLRILEAIEELNEARPDSELAVRAAVTTGEALVALHARPEQGESIVTGDVVNTASRLQGAAPSGALVADESTYRATRDFIEYEALEPVTVKGKTETIPIWRARAALSRLGPQRREGGATPFVGREHELAVLKEAYARALREPTIQLVTLVGEPGVGKSRLIAEFRAFVLDEPVSVVWRLGRCLPYGEAVTFWALGEIVKEQAGVLESDDAEKASEKLAEAVRGVVAEPSEHDWFQARLAPLAGAYEPAAAAERSELFTAWRRFLEELASSAPLVLVFEDLHWADEPMLEFVEHLVDWSAGVPLLVACTARPELYERRAGWGGGTRNATTLSLSPLTTEETARLVAALLPEAVLPAETQSTLLERSGGNPLYAEEFVRMLTDRGVLERRGHVFEIASSAQIAVPETLQALIAARLDTLPAERKSLLQAAAVVGRAFWSGAVASVSGVAPDAVEEALHELARKEFVRRVRTSSVQGEEEYSFWHALVREVAYRQIPRAARAAKHLSAAEWIERLAGDRVTDYAELLAHHYDRALELSRTAGADTTDLEEQTKRFLVLAGDGALRLDVGKAHSYYRRALELIPIDNPARARVLAKAAETAGLAGRYAEAEAGYAEAIDALKEQGDRLAAGESLVKLGDIVRDRGEAARARSLLAEAVELLEREPPGPALVLAYTLTARYLHFLGPAEPVFEFVDKAVRTAKELGIEEQGKRAFVLRGFKRFELGDLGGLDDVEEALRSGLEHGFGEDTAAAFMALGDLVWWTRGPADGLDVYRTGMEFTERRGMTYYAMYLKGESVWPLFEVGEWDMVLDTAHEIAEWDRTSYQALLALPYEAHLQFLRGHVADAAALRDEFMPRARQSQDPQVLVPALATSALIEESRGEGIAAVPLIEELEAFTDGRGMWRAKHLPEALRVCVAVGAVELAERLLEGLEVAAPRHRHAVHTGRAIMAEAQERFEEALTLYEEAAERWTEFGFVLEQGQALLGAGRCLLALDRPEEAALLLQSAREIFETLGARALARDARVGLEQSASLRGSGA